MVTLTGTGVCGGIAIGTLRFFQRGSQRVLARAVEDPEAEVARYEAARQEALAQLKALYEKALGEVGEADAMIFDIHQMMLEDPDYGDSITGIIRDRRINAEAAVSETSDTFAGMFAAMDDPYMQGRAADVRDISSRLLGILQPGGEGGFHPGEPSVLGADDLAPSETIQLDKSLVLAFVTRGGSVSSHTSILARTLGIPAVVGVGEALDPGFEGREVIVDGYSGAVYVDPDPDTLQRLQAKQWQDRQKKELLEKLKGKDNVTLDGQTIDIYANIGSLSDLDLVLHNDAGGIGLFRSEFLYLEREDYPTEDQQFQVYRAAAERMEGKRVIIRTLDIGADKQAAYFQLPKEENPAMGLRAIRICLTRPEIFLTQLRAILRASAYGKLAVMFPMITAVEEVRQAKALLEKAKDQLRAEGAAFDEAIETGIMIETPAAVMISDLLAPEVDFFSVGTNDLTQYTLAVDRQNPQLDQFYRPHHPALLRMLRMAAEAAHKCGKWIGICGELAGDWELTATFLALHIDELSVSPGYVLGLRERVRSLDMSKERDEALSRL